MRVRIALALLVLGSFAGGAAADDDQSGDHAGQFGASASLSLGMRGIATYDDVDYCGDRSADTGTGNAAVCLGRAPVGLDLELSYGALARKEIVLEARIGLERDFGRTAAAGAGPRQVFLAPGMRFFFSEAKTAKIFTTIQLVVDFTGYENAAGEGRETDFGFRNRSGIWIDLHRRYGFYVCVSETLTFRRWLAGELALGVGFQGRYP